MQKGQNMDKDTRLVVKGYLALDKSRQKEVADIVKGHDADGTVSEDVRFYSSMGMGPYGTKCPCCGITKF
jgi:hypothetical protein